MAENNLGIKLLKILEQGSIVLDGFQNPRLQYGIKRGENIGGIKDSRLIGYVRLCVSLKKEIKGDYKGEKVQVKFYDEQGNFNGLDVRKGFFGIQVSKPRMSFERTSALPIEVRSYFENLIIKYKRT